MNYKKGTQKRGCMKSVMRYVSQMSKTLWDGQQLVSGIGCQPETAFDEFLSTKLLHHKEGGVMFYHMVQSFPKGADIDPRMAHEAARRLAGYFEGCEVLVCTHVDREHIHSHCIINSVNFETGRKVHMADEQIQELRVRNDQICEELGLVGASLIILLFLILIWRFFVIATHAKDLTGALIATGAMAHMMIQVILNIAVVTNSIPNTGITLPFISYGGTSVVFLLLEMGLVLSVSNLVE